MQENIKYFSMHALHLLTYYMHEMILKSFSMGVLNLKVKCI